MHKRDVILTVIGLIGAALWLALLQATAFNTVTISVGLLGVLMVIGRPQPITH